MKFEMTKDMRLNLLVGLMFFLVAIVAAYATTDMIRSSSTRKKQDELLDIEIDTKKRVNKAVREGKIAMLFGVGANDGIATEIPIPNNVPPADTAPEPDEEPEELSEYDQIMAIISDPYKAHELKNELLWDYGVLPFLPETNILPGTILQVFGIGFDAATYNYYKIIRDIDSGASIDISYPVFGIPILLYVKEGGNKETMFAELIDDYVNFVLPNKEEMVGPVIPVDILHERIVAQEFHDDSMMSEAAPAAEPDHIPHEEKMVEEVVTTTEEVDDGVIRAPFDGEIVEMRTGCFTIKAADKGMKITFDFDFCQVALNEIVKKGQILGSEK